MKYSVDCSLCCDLLVSGCSITSMVESKSVLIDAIKTVQIPTTTN